MVLYIKEDLGGMKGYLKMGKYSRFQDGLEVGWFGNKRYQVRVRERENIWRKDWKIGPFQVET